MSNDSLYDYDDAERPRGIFTESDREYLLTRGEGYSRQAAHARQKAIRERFAQAILDLALLADLPDAERREFFLSEGDDVANDYAVRETRAALAFFYRLADDLGSDFEHLLEEAIVQAEQRPASESSKIVFRTAEVNISPPEVFDQSRVRKILEEDSSAEELTRQELMMLLVLEHKIEMESDEVRTTWEEVTEDVANDIWEHWEEHRTVEPFPERGIDRGGE